MVFDIFLTDSSFSRVQINIIYSFKRVSPNAINLCDCIVLSDCSVNSISTLADFQYCKKLQDLYVRKNNIKDLNEICYLQDLQCLKCLWIDENPCADTCDELVFEMKILILNVMVT